MLAPVVLITWLPSSRMIMLEIAAVPVAVATTCTGPTGRKAALAGEVMVTVGGFEACGLVVCSGMEDDTVPPPQPTTSQPKKMAARAAAKLPLKLPVISFRGPRACRGK